jgi:predicted helicase
MDAESQTVLNTLTGHDFQDAFKKMAEALGTVHTRGSELLRL